MKQYSLCLETLLSKGESFSLMVLVGAAYTLEIIQCTTPLINVQERKKDRKLYYNVICDLSCNFLSFSGL